MSEEWFENIKSIILDYFKICGDVMFNVSAKINDILKYAKSIHNSIEMKEFILAIKELIKEKKIQLINNIFVKLNKEV